MPPVAPLKRMMTVDVFLRGVPARAVIDCGANVSVMARAFVDAQHETVSPDTSLRSAAMADGSRVAVQGIVHDVSMLMGATRHILDFIVLDVKLPGDVVLGLDWLERANPIIDWRKRTLTWSDTDTVIGNKAVPTTLPTPAVVPMEEFEPTGPGPPTSSESSTVKVGQDATEAMAEPLVRAEPVVCTIKVVSAKAMNRLFKRGRGEFGYKTSFAR